MLFRLLGPVEVAVDDRAVALPKPRSRAVLVRLLLSANRLVTTDSLIDALWGDAPPATARNQIQADISALRRTMRQGGLRDPIKTTATGYQISIAHNELDLSVFQQLCRIAGEQSAKDDPVATAAALRSGLDLWRGPPLGDVAGEFVSDARAALTEQYLLAAEDWAEFELRAGQHRRVVPELVALTSQHPLREGLIRPLVVALHRDGRTPDALAALRALRTALAEELGLDMPPTLADLEVSILRGDHGPGQSQPAHTIAVQRLSGPAVPRQVGVVAAGTFVPRQLPTVTRHFVGRAGEVGMLDMLAADGEIDRATVISVITGTAGVGKTALALHWAYRARDRYPDGQLYVNLSGFDPSGMVVAPAEAIRRFLTALDVPPQRIPADAEAQADLYRSLLADKRMLVVLDNARDADQVRPLLPGATGCFVLVTSRNRLASLVAAEGACPLPLNLLTLDEASELLTRRLGPARIAAEQGAVGELIARCARLPLALTIVATNAALRPHLSLAALADQLRHSRDQLGTLSTGDAAVTDLRAVLSWSYQALSADGARLFRLLGLHPGPDISVAAAASLAALPDCSVQPLLTELAGACLIGEQTPGRYAFHDLLRVYAADLARTTDSGPQRGAAFARLLDHYLHTAYAAALLLMPHRDPIALHPMAPHAQAAPLDGYEQAMSWFDAEHESVLAALTQAAESRLDSYVWQLAWTQQTYLDRRGHWQQLVAMQEKAVAAAERMSDHHALSRVHRQLGFAYIRLDRYDDAHLAYGAALRHARQAQDQTSEARIRLETAMVFEKQGRYPQAVECAQHALALYEVLQHRAGLARALNAVGWYRALLGDFRQTIRDSGQALVLLQELGNRSGEAETLHSLGYAHHHLGEHAAAIACYRRSLEIKRMLDHKLDMAQVLADLGETLYQTARHGAAHETWQEALAMLNELDHPDAHRYRTKIMDRVTRPELSAR